MSKQQQQQQLKVKIEIAPPPPKKEGKSRGFVLTCTFLPDSKALFVPASIPNNKTKTEKKTRNQIGERKKEKKKKKQKTKSSDFVFFSEKLLPPPSSLPIPPPPPPPHPFISFPTQKWNKSLILFFLHSLKNLL